MVEAIAVIPARYASVRFPGKVLADRTGKPLVQHVYERAGAASSITRVIVAADDPRIVDKNRNTPVLVKILRSLKNRLF